MKIAFVSPVDPNDKTQWSGIPYYMYQSLSTHIGEVEHIAPIHIHTLVQFGRALSYLSQKMLRKRLDYLHNKLVSTLYAQKVLKQLNKKHYDLIFAPAASSLIAHLDTSIPIIYSSDTTYANMIDYYPFYTRLLEFSKKQGLEIERRAIQNSSVCVFPSEWAAHSAINDFGAPKEKVHIIPYGANIDKKPSIEQILCKKKNNKCRLLFLGVDWNRKGGAIAFDTMIKMNEMGIDTELTVCGCIPPSSFSHSKMKVIPFINKNIPSAYEQFEQLMLQSDFLILPTRAECYGIVFCEASAFGLPSIATHTGGVNGAIKDGINGYLLPPNATGDDYAQLITKIFQNDDKYYALVQSSRKLYDDELNWDAWAMKLKKIIYALFHRGS